MATTPPTPPADRTPGKRFAPVDFDAAPPTRASVASSSDTSGDFTRAVYEVARKEVLQHLRTKRLLIIGGLLTAALVLMTLIIGPQIMDSIGDPEAGIARENFVFLFYFSTYFIGGYFFIQLLAIVLTADGVCSEWQSRTIFLLLSKPVSRTAFVLGKFLGSYVTIAATVFLLFTLDYLVMQGVYEGSPTGEEWLRFFGAIGVLILGAGAFAALALFFSTLTRSTVMSLLMTLGVWIIVLPLVAQIGVFTTIGDRDFDGGPDSPRVDWSRYLSPGSDMSVAGEILVEDDEARGFVDLLSGTPKHTWIALVALVGHTVLWSGLSILVVRRRNFE